MRVPNLVCTQFKICTTTKNSFQDITPHAQAGTGDRD